MNPNKKSQCDYCAFLLPEDQSNIYAEREVEEKYSVLRNLIGAPKKTRKISIGGSDAKTETCFINSPNWTPSKNNQTHCDDFMDNNISLPDALKSRETKLLSKALNDATHIENNPNNSVTNWYEKPIGMIGIMLIAAILAALAIYLIKTYIGIKL